LFLLIGVVVLVSGGKFVSVNAVEAKNRLLQTYDEIVTIQQTLALSAEALLSSGIEVLEFEARAS